VKTITTYVGVDAHKKDLFIAMSPTGTGGGASEPVTECIHSLTRLNDGPRRRRMIRGTIVRIGELA
jgi:hypothetical protein